MKGNLFRIIMMLMMFINVINGLAEYPFHKGKFIKDILIFADNKKDHAFNKSEEYVKKYLDPNSWACAQCLNRQEYLMGDLNYDKGSDYRVYILYQTTDNVYEAITDIMVVSAHAGDGSYSGDKGKTIEYNGKKYQAARYSKSGELGDTDIDSRGGNLNRGMGSGTPNLYLYYTKDGSTEPDGSIKPGGKVLRRLDIQYSDKSLTSEIYAAKYDPYNNQITGSADCREGCGGKHIYIRTSLHTHTDAGPDVEKCDCGEIAKDYMKPAQDSLGVFLIENLSNLVWWRNHVNSDNWGSSAKLTFKGSELDAKNLANIKGKWVPIGFKGIWTGTFYGNNKAIKNFTNVRGSDSDSGTSGLFYRAGGTIKDLTLKDVNINGLAALVSEGHNGLTIDNCKISGQVKSQSAFGAAAFVFLDSYYGGPTVISISNSENAAQCSSKGLTSGFVLGNNNGQTINLANIEKCINSGNVHVAFCRNVGGSIKNCLNTSNAPIIETYYEGLSLKSILSFGNGITRDNSYVPNNSDRCYSKREINDDQIKNGEVCYWLNNEQSHDSVVWRQKLIDDDIPTPMHNDQDRRRIVYHYSTKPECKLHGYTNNWFYADDMNGRDHMFTYYGVPDSHHLQTVKKTCIICGDVRFEDADLVETRRINNPTCRNGGRELRTYKLKDSEILFYKLWFIKGPQHLLNHFANPIRIDDVTEECRTCGAQRRVTDIKTKVSDKYGWEIYDIYDFIAYFDACYDVFGTKSKSPNATLFTDIDLTQANKIDSKWFATTFLKEDTTSSWHDATFDGNGHTIKGLFPTAFPDSTQRGLFGYIDKGRVKNLTIDGIAWDSDNSALLCGKASNSTFENITIKGYVKSRHGRAAGLCDEAYNCKFLRCHNFANIESPDNSIGGIVAIAEGGSIRECTNQANIDGRQSKYVGGLVGNYTGEFLIENSGNYGNVIGKDCVGGIVGAFAIPETYFYTQQSQRSSNLYNSLNVGDITITGESYDKGGLAGFCALPDSLVSINETELDAFMDMQIQNSYYKGSQLMIGSAENTTSERKNIKCTDAQLTSGEICYNLNNKKNDTDVIWHQDLGNQIYPYPYGDKLLPPSVNVNDGAIFVAANSTIDSLTIHPDTYGEDSYFHTDVSFTVKEMKYIRKATVKKNFYATLYLPFAFSDERLKILDFDYYDNETGTVYFKDVEGMTVPNHPYIVRMADSYDKDSVIQLVISAENALVVPDTSTIDIEKQIDCIPTGFYGTYAFRRIYGNNGFYAYSSANGDFRKANSVDGNPVYPFRCVFKVGPDATAPATIDFVAPEDGGVTNISSSKIVEIDTNTSIYNLNGQAVGNSFNSLKPGIYIYKGKKIYIK